MNYWPALKREKPRPMAPTMTRTTVPDLFKPGKVTFCLDGGAGSSAKGLRGAYIWKHLKADHTRCVANTFMSNAAHTITHEDGREYVHQCLSSISSLGDYDKQYLGPGCCFSIKEFVDEIANFPDAKVGLHPNAAIVTKADIDYERGKVDFEGNIKSEIDSANLRLGSTLHGVGAARARRVLRRKDAVIARDVPELAKFICHTQEEILDRLNSGESCLGEIAQGYQLSLFSDFYPKVTSRNCSVSAFLDDSLLPPSVAGPVVVNFRTFPIRVNNNKYIRKSDSKILTWREYQETDDNDRAVIVGDSGGCYYDQEELSWEQISESAGEEITELTSLTQLPRRVYNFSRVNLVESILFNNTGDDVYISLNFMNYVDPAVKGVRSIDEVMTDKVVKWLSEYIFCDGVMHELNNNKIDIKGLFIGTWKAIDDSVYISRAEIDKICR